MTVARLIIVGDGLVARQAAAIAARGDVARVVECELLTADQIWRTDLDFLQGCDPATTEVFAAVGLEALNFARSDLWGKLRIAGFRSARLVHPAAAIDPTAHVGGNCLVDAHASIGPGAKIGEGTILGAGARVDAGATVGAFSWLGANASIGGDTEIGTHTVLGAGVHVAARLRIGANCEVSVPGSYDRSLDDGTFISALFASAARIHDGRQHRTQSAS